MTEEESQRRIAFQQREMSKEELKKWRGSRRGGFLIAFRRNSFEMCFIGGIFAASCPIQDGHDRLERSLPEPSCHPPHPSQSSGENAKHREMFPSKSPFDPD